MSRWESGGSVYDVAARWVESALRQDGSLFTPGRAIWTVQWLDELDRRYVQNPDLGSDSFETKLAGQLAGSPPEVYQLMGEVAYVYYLPAGWNITGAKKREKIGEILGFSPAPVAIPDDLAASLDDKVGSGGPGFHLYKWASLAFLIAFARRFKQQAPERRDSLLADPWAFLDFVHEIPTEGGGIYGRESLLHLVFPDTFERTFSGKHKWQLANTLKDLADDPNADPDRRIYSIRQKLAAQFGSDFDFYDTDGVRLLWDPVDRWGQFVYWGNRFRQLADYEKEERDYKLEVMRHLTVARDALRAGGDWIPLLKRAFGPPNNLTAWQAHDKFVKWCEADPTAARELLTSLWEGQGDALARFAAFARDLPKAVLPGQGARTTLSAFLLMALDPYNYPPYRVTALHTAYKLTGYKIGPEPDEITAYENALAFLDELRDRSAQKGLDLRDRLDAQSVAWCVATYDPPADWTSEDRHALVLFRAGTVDPGGAQPGDDEDVDGGDTPVPGDTVETLADELLLDPEALAEIVGMVRRKRQVVFYGPPGTGKTFVARKLAKTLAGDGSRVTTVQFHPSYAYEDFVEGFRPRAADGPPRFDLVRGPLRAAERAREDPGHDYYIVIDELNRGNVAKVFGELYFLLEYRDEPLVLQYSAEAFLLPKNLYFIGTMNTADRSIALLDAALRRRFAFVPFFPDRPPVAGLLRRWLQRNRSAMLWVADVVDLANERLADRNGAIGPSFFMQADLDEERLRRTWRHEILPYLEDYFFDAPDRVAAFEIDALRKEHAKQGLQVASLLGPAEEAAAEFEAASDADDAPPDAL